MTAQAPKFRCACGNTVKMVSFREDFLGDRHSQFPSYVSLVTLSRSSLHQFTGLDCHNQVLGDFYFSQPRWRSMKNESLDLCRSHCFSIHDIVDLYFPNQRELSRYILTFPENERCGASQKDDNDVACFRFGTCQAHKARFSCKEPSTLCRKPAGTVVGRNCRRGFNLYDW